MTRPTFSDGKQARLRACSNPQGLITALAVDHRTPLQHAIAAARGPHGTASAEDMLAFKQTVARVLSPQVSAILLDPEYSLPAIPSVASGTGMMLAYEKTGYDSRIPGRLPDLLPEWSARQLLEQGASGIKILLYYNPFDAPSIKRIKHAFVERIGAECAALELPFYLEPIVYDDAIGDEKGAAFARHKPRYVSAAAEEFSKPRYGVDVLKLEVPVQMPFVAGTRALAGEALYSRQEALDAFRRLSNVAQLPFIFLSAGVSDEVFREALELAAEAGTPYSGVLCGRATWQDGIAIYATQGVTALEEWLATRGVQNVAALNAVLEQSARPWWQG